MWQVLHRLGVCFVSLIRLRQQFCVQILADIYLLRGVIFFPAGQLLRAKKKPRQMHRFYHHARKVSMTIGRRFGCQGASEGFGFKKTSGRLGWLKGDFLRGRVFSR